MVENDTNTRALAARKEKIADEVLDLIGEVCDDDAVRDERDLDLFEAGLLDSLAAIELQRACERRAFELGGGAYRAPAQLVGDFLERRASTGAGGIEPTYPLGVTWCEIDSALPSHVVNTLRAGIPALDRKLHGYANPEAVLTGVETRSSSPVTVVRDRTCQAEGTPGLFPCGEGAGYAGGIMSAATDGVRCAEALIASLRDNND